MSRNPYIDQGRVSILKDGKIPALCNSNLVRRSRSGARRAWLSTLMKQSVSVSGSGYKIGGIYIGLVVSIRV